MITWKYDEEGDALYVTFSEQKSRGTTAYAMDFMVDYGEAGIIVGVEVLSPLQLMHMPDRAALTDEHKSALLAIIGQIEEGSTEGGMVVDTIDG